MSLRLRGGRRRPSPPQLVLEARGSANVGSQSAAASVDCSSQALRAAGRRRVARVRRLRKSTVAPWKRLKLLLNLASEAALPPPRARRLCRFYMRVCNSTSFQLCLMWHTGRQSPSYSKGR